jgi:DNA-binding transcriptional LysR family regulator
MDFRQLKALLAIADTGSMTKAAEMLNIVQPAVSRQLKLLEEDVGVVLFERHRMGMQLTPDGEILAAYARRVLQELERARGEIRPGQHALQGKVSVGLLPSTAERLAYAGQPLRARISGIRLQFLVGYAGHMQTWLEQEKPIWRCCTIRTHPLYCI